MSRILIVDDDLGIRNLCYEAFTQDGHEVITVPRGDHVFDAIQKHGKIDLILMDIIIPGEEGLSLLKCMPNQKENRIPVAMFSGAVTEELEKEAYERGAVDVIRKGIGAKELRKRVYELLPVEGQTPTQNKTPAQNQSVEESEKKAPSKKILVVDDEANIRNLLQEFFESKGFDTLTAKNGEEAIELVKKEKPVMILLDVAMPGMDGVVTLKKIREFDSKVGIVMATGARDEELLEEIAKFGVYEYVLKPFDMKYFEMVVLTRFALSN